MYFDDSHVLLALVVPVLIIAGVGFGIGYLVFA